MTNIPVPSSTSEMDTLLYRLSERKKQILVQLALCPYIGYRRLSKKLGVSVSNVRSHLKRSKGTQSLSDLGLTYPTVPGWILTPLGEKCARKLQDDEKWFQFLDVMDEVLVDETGV